MKKLILLALALTLGTSAFAQKLARIDFEKVAMEMPEYKEMTLNMEKLTAETRSLLQLLDDEFSKKRDDYQKNVSTMSDTERQIRERELMALQANLEESFSVEQRKLEVKQQELTAPIVDKAEAAVKKVAQKHGYLAVFNTGLPTMVYYDEAAMVDISAEVRKELGI